MFVEPMALVFVGTVFVLGFAVVAVYVAVWQQRVAKASGFAEDTIAQYRSFILQITHELRNPLQTILGASELLPNDAVDDQRQQAQIIRSAAENLQMVAANLLGYFGGVQYVAEWSRVDLRALLNSAHEATYPLAFEKGIKLTLDAEHMSQHEINLDEQHVRHILCNVFAHAIGITDAGGVQVFAKTAPAEAGNVDVELRVVHSGMTFSKQTCAAFFEPFGLNDRVPGGHPPGVGLNLHVARAFAREVGGDVTYNSCEEGGGEYFVRVRGRSIEPVSTDGPRLAGVVVPIDDVYARHRFMVPQKRVLVAEDITGIQMVLTEMLERAGHVVHVAASGDDALNLLSSHDIDVAFIDVFLNDMSGVDVIKVARVQQAGVLRKTQYIVVTGDASERVRRNCLDAGASAFLVKPVRVRTLLDTMFYVCHRADTAERDAFRDNPDVLRAAPPAQLVNPALRDIMPGPMIAEAIRDALRYLSAMEVAALTLNWQSALELAAAVRGVALMLGAHFVMHICTQMLERSTDELAYSWTADFRQLTVAVRQVSEALSHEGTVRPLRA